MKKDSTKPEELDFVMKVFSFQTSNKLSIQDTDINTKFVRIRLNFINKLNEGTVSVTVSSQVKTKQKNNLTAALAAIQKQITKL